MVKLWKFRGVERGTGGGGGRAYTKFPPWWGVDILRLHNKDHLSKVTVNLKTRDDRINCITIAEAPE